MTCDEFKVIGLDYGKWAALTRGERACFVAHMETCQPCQDFLDEHGFEVTPEQSAAMGKQAFEDFKDPEFSGMVMRAFADRAFANRA